MPWTPARWAQFALAFASASACAPLAAQTAPLAEAPGVAAPPAGVEAARAIAAALYEEADLPALSIAVGRDGVVLWSEAFGHADLENGTPATPLSKFRIGSVSKPLTATAIGLLVQRGRLDLDAPVQRYVPYFPEKGWPVTTRQAAGHVAGIRHYRGDEFLSDELFETVREGVEIFADDSLLFQPGTDYSYSSYGWNLISAVIEAASDTPFLEFMREDVIRAIGLRHTVAEHMDSIIAYRVRYYDRTEDGRLINSPDVDNSYKWAGGGYLSTPEDLVRFGRAYLDGDILAPETVALLWEPQTLASGESTGYGIGWGSDDDWDGHRVVGHTGGSVGGTTALNILPEHDVIVAAVSNLSDAPGLNDLTLAVAEAMEAGPRDEPPPAGLFAWEATSGDPDERPIRGILALNGERAGDAGWLRSGDNRARVAYAAVRDGRLHIIAAGPAGILTLDLPPGAVGEGTWDGDASITVRALPVPSRS